MLRRIGILILSQSSRVIMTRPIFLVSISCMTFISA